MPKHIPAPTRIEAAGVGVKLIDEFFGAVNSGDSALSIAHMQAPGGWEEPGQRPEFDEYTVVLKGTLRVDIEGGAPIDVSAGQAIHTRAGEWIRYSTLADGAEYIAVCLPAFSPVTVHRDA